MMEMSYSVPHIRPDVHAYLWLVANIRLSGATFIAQIDEVD